MVGSNEFPFEFRPICRCVWLVSGKVTPQVAWCTYIGVWWGRRMPMHMKFEKQPIRLRKQYKQICMNYAHIYIIDRYRKNESEHLQVVTNNATHVNVVWQCCNSTVSDSHDSCRWSFQVLRSLKSNLKNIVGLVPPKWMPAIRPQVTSQSNFTLVLLHLRLKSHCQKTWTGVTFSKEKTGWNL